MLMVAHNTPMRLSDRSLNASLRPAETTSCALTEDIFTATSGFTDKM